MTDCPLCGSRLSVDADGYCNALGCNVRGAMPSRYHIESAARFRAMVKAGILVEVPLTDAEKLPDPDYGF